MKPHPILAAGVLCVMLSACATAQLNTGKSLAAAQTLVSSAGDAALPLCQPGAASPLTPATCKAIDKVIDDADTASLTARCAYAANDLTTVSGVLASMGAMASAITAIAAGETPPTYTAPTAQSCAKPAAVSAVVVAK